MAITHAKTSFRLLLLADTHIGLDHPVRPRIERRRRGDDFLANFRLALQPALHGEVDLVVHGGDLFDRCRVPAAVVQLGLEPLLEVAEQGVPVFLVPGNHERARIPLHLWRSHPHLHIFDRPATFSLTKNGVTLALSGFPFSRRIFEYFPALLTQCSAQRQPAHIRLLCMHQAVEGARVGPANFTFRSGADVLRGVQIPPGFCALLSGHIHRTQVLRQDLGGRPLNAPVVYPGSVERTAFAEQGEVKGYMLLTLTAGNQPGGRLVKIEFHPLPARPMLTLDIYTGGLLPAQAAERLRAQLAGLDAHTVVRIRLHGDLSADTWQVFSAASLRSLAPGTMNITLSAAWGDRGSQEPRPSLPTRSR